MDNNYSSVKKEKLIALCDKVTNFCRDLFSFNPHSLKFTHQNMEDEIESKIEEFVDKSKQFLNENEVKRFRNVITNFLNTRKPKNGELAIFYGSSDLTHAYEKILDKLNNSMNEETMNLNEYELKFNAQDINNPDYNPLDAAKKRASDKNKEEIAQKEKQAFADKQSDILKKINKDTSLEDLFDMLVPSQGMSDTLAGELIRALFKVSYRWFNDGDRFFDGYGLETCGSAAAFIVDALNKYCDDNGIECNISDMIYECAENNCDDGDYDDFIKDLENSMHEFILKHKDLITTKNDIDMIEYENAKEYWEDVIPRYEYSIDLSDTIIDMMNRENIDIWDVIKEFESYMYGWGVFDGAEIDRPWGHQDEYITISNLTSDGLHEIKSWDNGGLWNDYDQELIDTYGEEDEEEYDEEDDFEEAYIKKAEEFYDDELNEKTDLNHLSDQLKDVAKYIDSELSKSGFDCLVKVVPQNIDIYVVYDDLSKKDEVKNIIDKTLKSWYMYPEVFDFNRIGSEGTFVYTISKIRQQKPLAQKENEISKSDKDAIIKWWKDVEKWNKSNDNKFSIDNGDYSDIEGLHSAMFDLLKDLPKGELKNKGKKLYNKYALSQFNENLDDLQSSTGHSTWSDSNRLHSKEEALKEEDDEEVDIKIINAQPGFISGNNKSSKGFTREEANKFVDELSKAMFEDGNYYEIYPEIERDDTYTIVADIDGDWKHDHMYFNHFAHDFFFNKGIEVVIDEQEASDEDGMDDWWHGYHTIKKVGDIVKTPNEESTIKIN